MTGRVVKQIGWIPYLNLLPFYSELRQLVGGSIEFLSGHPSTVNRWLTQGVVDLAPASSIAMLFDPKLKMAAPIGIASEGCVQSVYIGLHLEHHEFYEFIQFRQTVLSPAVRDAVERWDAASNVQILRDDTRYFAPEVIVPKLRLTPASAASVALTEVLLYLWCGDQCAGQTISAARGPESLTKTHHAERSRPMELVIGDEALKRRHEFWQVLDLGQVWHELTGLPFVFGLWQTTDAALPPELIELVMRAAKISERKMRVEPEIYFPDECPLLGDGTNVDLSSYWSVIQYGLTRRHIQSLSIYYRLVTDVSRKTASDNVAVMEVQGYLEQAAYTV